MITQNVLDFNNVGVFQDECHISRVCRGVLKVTMYLWGRSEAQLPTRDGELEKGGVIGSMFSNQYSVIGLDSSHARVSLREPGAQTKGTKKPSENRE